MTVTSFQSVDNLVEGESFYMAEAKSILQLINGSRQNQYLIIVDEIFKGTNSIERTAISKASLDYLHNSSGIVLVSTHDLELVKLLSRNFEPYHFYENFENDQVVFDYKIKKGKLYVFNAIKTLEKLKFPEALMEDVVQTFTGLNEQYIGSAEDNDDNLYKKVV